MASVALTAPAGVLEVIGRLQKAGFEAWCVGGGVRDALLSQMKGENHRPAREWDIATSARPDEVKKVFRRTIPVGVEHGTVGIFDSDNVMYEVTTFRKDVKTDGRHAVVEFGASLDDDLARRDFTINAIAYNPETGELRDPFDGRTDLKRGVVRAVGVAEDRMREDRLRALRGIRFASRFRFHIEPGTWIAIKHSAPHMGRLSAERVKQELEKTMQQVEKPSTALEWWRESGALKALVPSIADAPRERFRAMDLLQLPLNDDNGGNDGNSRIGLPGAKGTVLNRLAMLFFGGVALEVAAATKALKFSNLDSAWIVAMAAARAGIGAEIDGVLEKGPAEAAQIRRWVAQVGRTRTDAFCEMNGALHLARRSAPDATTGAVAPDAGLAERLAEFRRAAVEIAFRDPIEIADLAIDGEDLRAAGVPAGPEMGRVLKTLLERVIEDPALNTVASLTAVAKTFATSR